MTRLGLFIGLLLTLAAPVSGIELSLSNPQPFALIPSSHVFVSGSVQGATAIYLNGASFPLNPTGEFSALVPISLGLSTLNILAIEAGEPPILKSIPLYSLKTFPDCEDNPAKTAISLLTTALQMGPPSPTPFFYPNDPIRRSEVALLIAKLNRLPLSGSATEFSDLRADHWAYPSIQAAYRYSLMSLASEATWLSGPKFAPDGLVTRLEALQILFKFSRVIPFLRENTPLFDDIKPDFWGYRFVDEARKKDLIPTSWLKNPSFFPYKPVARGEFYAMLFQTPVAVKSLKNYFKNAPFAERLLIRPEWRLSEKCRVEQAGASPAQGNVTNPVTLSIKWAPGSEKPQRVFVDLSAINRMENFELYDDGRFWDASASDTIFSAQVRPTSNTPPGLKILPFMALDSEGKSVYGEFRYVLESPKAALKKEL